MTLADRLVVMNKGTIEQVGTPAEIYDRPASLYVAGFIGSPAMNFLPGQYDAARRAVVLEGGAVIGMPADHEAADGQLVQLGIRPEHVSLRAPGQGMIDARLEIVEDLGAARLWNLKIEDIPFSLITEARPHIETGAVTGLALDLRHAHLFDGVSGKRIDAKTAAGAMRAVPAL
jgi:sn-glycerol 3-phosphate transport system ATP-binding protein